MPPNPAALIALLARLHQNAPPMPGGPAGTPAPLPGIGPPVANAPESDDLAKGMFHLTEAHRHAKKRRGALFVHTKLALHHFGKLAAPPQPPDADPGVGAM